MHRIVLLVIDLCVIAIATVSALVLRDNLVFSLDRLYGALPYLVATLLAATVILPGFGLHRTLWRFSTLSDYLRIVGAGILIVLCAVGIGFAVDRLESVARSLPILQGVLIVAALVGVRVAMRLRHNARKTEPPRALSEPEHSGRTETVLVFGLNSIAELFLQSVKEFAADRVKVAGLLGRSERHTGRLLRQHTILGATEQLDSVLKDLEVHGIFVDRIVVTQAFDNLSPLAREALQYVERTSDIRVDFFAERIGLYEDRDREATTPKAQETAVDDERLLSIAVDLASAANHPYWLAKRALDVIGAACLIILLAPLMGLVALIVAIDVGLPTVFWQQRPGFRGRPFKLLKFRTMGAAHDNHGRRVQEKQRLSAVGAFLRRSRLDELPQHFNILFGDMSFVGPRPLLPVDQSQEHRYRLFARPGLTGWAQVNGGRDISAEAKGALDIWYVRNATLLLDLKIAWLTLGMLTRGECPNGRAIRQASLELQLPGLVGAENLGSPVLDEGPALASGHLRPAA